MSVLLRRPTRVECFYCQTQVDPPNPRSFRCPACQCWNRYDTNNEIISEEPAMHDENLNARSFARRASPRKDRLPTMYGKGVFCHTCQTNQMLLSNLLSNYLPPVDDPEYTRRSELFPAYRASIEIRYPPVCAQCQPAVEEEIRKRDQMARTSALGAFLKDSRGKGKQRQVSENLVQKEKLERALVMWRVRGGLWVVSLLLSLSSYLAVATGYRFASIPRSFTPAIPAIAAISLLWTAWDPTFATMKRHQLQGRSVRQRGKQEYNILQSLAWISRLITCIIFSFPVLKHSWNITLMQAPTTPATRIYCCSAIVLELLILIRSLMVLRVQRPPPVHLLDTRHRRPSSISPPPPSKHSSRGLTPQAEPDLMASLSLSNQPILPPATSKQGNPIFGLPSLPTTTNSQPQSNGELVNYDMDEDEEQEQDPNAMDWTPTNTPAKPRGRVTNATQRAAHEHSSWLLRPQKFFAPEEPTGLETLFARTISLSDVTDEQSHGGKKTSMRSTRWGTRHLSWCWVALCVIGLVPLLVGVVYKVWERKRDVWEVIVEE